MAVSHVGSQRARTNSTCGWPRRPTAASIWCGRSGIPAPAIGRPGWAVPAGRSRSAAHRRSWARPASPPAIARLAVTAPMASSRVARRGRAIVVQLARVMRGQSRLLAVTRRGWSAARAVWLSRFSQADSPSSILVTPTTGWSPAAWKPSGRTISGQDAGRQADG
jgi:hypothetical protein